MGGKLLMIIIFFVLGLIFFLFTLKKALLLYKARTRGVRISGTVKSGYSAAEDGISKKKGFMAFVEFDSESLLNGNCPPTEVYTGKNLMHEGDSVSCIYFPDSQTVISKNSVPDLTELIMSFAMALVFMAAPAVPSMIEKSGMHTLFLGVGIFGMFISLLCFIPSIKSRNGSFIELSGEISNVQVKYSDGSELYGYEYTFYYNGKLHRSPAPDTFRTYGRNIPRAGDPVTVYYDEETDDFSEKGNIKTMALMGGIFLLTALIFTIVAILGFIGASV